MKEKLKILTKFSEDDLLTLKVASIPVVITITLNGLIYSYSLILYLVALGAGLLTVFILERIFKVIDSSK